MFDGASCLKDPFTDTYCSPCGGIGSRCHFCMYCTGYCSGSGNTNGNNVEERSTDYVEAPYKFPLQKMFNSIMILLFQNMLECEDLNYQFRQILGQLKP